MKVKVGPIAKGLLRWKKKVEEGAAGGGEKDDSSVGYAPADWAGKVRIFVGLNRCYSLCVFCNIT